MKRWQKYALGVSLGLAVAGYALHRSGVLVRQFKGSLERALATASGRPLSLGDLYGGLTGRVSLVDVKLGDDPARGRDAWGSELSARRLDIDLSLWSLLRGRSIVESLRQLRLRGASLRLLAPAGGVPSAAEGEDDGPSLATLRQALQALPPLALETVIEDGQVVLIRPGRNDVMLTEKLDLRAWPRVEGGLHLRGTARMGSGRLGLQAWLTQDLAAGEGELNLDDLSLAWIEARFRPGKALFSRAGLASGKVKVRLADPGARQWLRGLELEARLKVRQAELAGFWKDLSLKQASAALSLGADGLKLDELRAESVGGRLQGEGSLGRDLTTLRFDVRADQVDATLLSASLGARQAISATGKMSLQLQVGGSLEGLTLQAKADMPSGSLAGQQVSGLAASLRVTPLELSLLSLRAAVGGGSISAAGSLRRARAEEAWERSALSGTARLEKLPMAMVAAPLGLSSSAGILEASIEASGSMDRPTLRVSGRSASAVLAGVKFEGTKFEAVAKAGSVTAKASAKVDNRDWSLRSDLYLGTGKVRIRMMEVELERRRVARGSGVWSPDGGAVQAELAWGPFEPSQIPALSTLSHLKGAISGKAAFDREAGQWSGTVGFAADKLNASGVDVPLRGQARLAQGVWNLESLSLRGKEAQATGSWRDDDKTWEIQGQLTAADLSAVAALLRAKGAFKGRMDGSFKFKRTPHSEAPDLWLDLAGTDLAYGDVAAQKAALKVRRSEGHWQLDALSAEQAEGGRATAKGSLGAKGQSESSLELTKWALAKRELSGKVGLTARASGEGQAWHIDGNGLRIGGADLPVLDADGQWQASEWTLKKMAWGAGLNLSGHLGKDGFEARADLEDWDGSALVTALHGKAVTLPGRLKGEVVAKGVSPGAGLQSLAWMLAGLDASGKGSFKGMVERVAQHWSGQASLRGADLAWCERIAFIVATGRDEAEPWVSGMADASFEWGPGPAPLKVSLTASGVTVADEVAGLVTLQGRVGLKEGSLDAFHSQSGTCWVSIENMAYLWPSKGTFSAAGDIEGAGYPLVGGMFVAAAQGRLELKSVKGGIDMLARAGKLKVNERSYPAADILMNIRERAFSLQSPPTFPAFKTSMRFPGKAFFLDVLEARQGKGKGSLTGTISEQGVVDFEGTAGGFPAGELASLLGWTQEWKGQAYGSLALKGTRKEVRTTVSVKVEDGSVDGFLFDLAQARVQVQDGWVDLSPLEQPLRFSRKNAYQALLTGRIPLKREGVARPPMDLKVEFPVADLNMLTFLEGIRKGKGPIKLSLRLHGDPDDPEIEASAEVEDGMIEPAWSLPPLNGVRVSLKSEGRQVRLQTGQARVDLDGPLLKVELVDPEKPAWVFSRYQPSRMNLRVRSSRSGWALKNSPELDFLQGTLHADLALTGDWQSPRLSGQVEFEKGVATWPPRFSRPGPEEPDPRSFSGRLFYEVLVKAQQEVMVRTDSAQVTVDTGAKGLRITGAGKDRQVYGRLKAKRGTVDLMVANFQIATDRETSVEFLGRQPTLIDLWGVKRIKDVLVAGATYRRDMDVSLHAFGPLGKVQMQLSSTDSSVTETQLASLLGLGTDATDPRGTQAGLARMLGKLPASILTRAARRSGIFDDVGVKSPALEDVLSGVTGTAQGVSPKARTLVEVKASKAVSDKVSVGVSAEVSEKQLRTKDGQDQSSTGMGGAAEVEVRLTDKSKLSLQSRYQADGQTEQKVLLERHASFENYDGRKRRYQSLATPIPSPTPKPTPKPTPWATAEPEAGHATEATPITAIPTP